MAVVLRCGVFFFGLVLEGLVGTGYKYLRWVSARFVSRV